MYKNTLHTTLQTDILFWTGYTMPEHLPTPEESVKKLEKKQVKKLEADDRA